MTDLLKQAFAAAAHLTEAQQDELAEILLSLVGADPDDGPGEPLGEVLDMREAVVTRH